MAERRAFHLIRAASRHAVVYHSLSALCVLAMVFLAAICAAARHSFSQLVHTALPLLIHLIIPPPLFAAYYKHRAP